FVAAVDQQNSAPPAKPSDAPNKMLDGRFAILTGLMGLDCEHGCTVEIHPLWALAIHAEDRKDDDEWALLVRNWGNEGFCSHQQHYLNLLADQYTLRLPWRPQATAVEVLIDQSSYCQNFAFAPASPTQPANNLEVTFKPGEAILVKITLPRPDRGAFVLGDLHLKWINGQTEKVHSLVPKDSNARCASIQPPAARSAEPKAGDRRLAEIMLQMTPEQLRIYRQHIESGLSSVRALRAAAVPSIITESMRCTPFQAPRLEQNELKPPTAEPTVGVGTALRTQEAHDIEAKAVCAALGDKAKDFGLDKACKKFSKRR